MTRLLAIICVFLIVIGLYSAWRYPRVDGPEPDPVSTAVTPADESQESEIGTLEDPVPDDLASDTVETSDPVTPRGKERSLDR
jgi:hypothetical protein